MLKITTFWKLEIWGRGDCIYKMANPYTSISRTGGRPLTIFAFIAPMTILKMSNFTLESNLEVKLKVIALKWGSVLDWVFSRLGLIESATFKYHLLFPSPLPLSFDALTAFYLSASLSLAPNSISSLQSPFM